MPNSGAKFDAIAIGDATLDTFLRINDALIVPSHDQENKMVCLPYADKILVQSLEQQIAGNAASNAIGSARLGLKSAFYSIVGNDDSGKKIIAAMKKEGVSTKYLKVDKKRPTNYTVAINYDGERTLLIYRLDRDYKLPKLAKSNWIYYTAVGKNHINMESEIIAYVKSSGAKLAFNPGDYQLQRGAKALKGVLNNTTVLFVNKEEGKKLVGQYEPLDLMLQLRALGPKIIVVTDGPNGAYAYDGEDAYHMRVFPVKLVEMTGAGDSFATGFMAAMYNDKDIFEALRWGTANSASVISYVGPQKGLLTKKGMKDMLARFKNIKPKKI
ncbi:MAG: carbohydrate kinase family protein [Patescibacteria group bacterium]